ncbi:phage terminase small subunit [Nocardioides stalactiti]|uniref:phage terminase small subunit n=1 Tax=Nocardioides stalactiti TaxID=2755356 RepID=UPI0015FF5C39|nr:hypothetical protein [Nocardioides stalactiti]
MAGRGPAPKDPNERRRRNAGGGSTSIEARPAAQPDLPEFNVVTKKGDAMTVEPFAWPERTRDWWRMWGESPLTENYGSTDWDFLLDTALIHARFWQGDTSQAPELRLRVAKFGATPEDRARLKIEFTPAPGSPAPSRPSSASKARKQRVLRAVGDDE